jgi:hypothetical protein
MTDKLSNNNINDNTILGGKLSDATIPLGKLAAGVVQLQASTPGTAQTGHLNISGTGTFGNVAGNGSGLTNVNASTLGGVGPVGFIWNSSTAQTAASFNIQGSGTIGGTIAASTLSVAGNGTIGGTLAAANVSGNGSGLTSLPAAALTGTVPDGSLSANVARLNATQTFSGTNTFAGLILPNSASAPTSASVGQVYFNTTSKTLQYSDGTAWRLATTQRTWTTLGSAFTIPNVAGSAVVTGLNTQAAKATATSTVKLTFTGNLTFPSSPAGLLAQVQFVVDGVATGQVWTYSDSTATYLSRPFTCIATLSAVTLGTHTYGIQVQTNSGPGDTVAAGSTLIVEEDN